MEEIVAPAAARALFLEAQGLLDDPARRATRAAVAKLIDRLGFVQLDSINRVERAHHLILGTRLDGYRPALLDRLAFTERRLFEHRTHDAAYIPVALFPYWKPRFPRHAKRLRGMRWFSRRLGKDPDRIIAAVQRRLEREGPLSARDFERERPAEGWWDWSPEKTALEYLWWTGVIATSARDGFDKVYDLTERVLPDAHAAPTPEHDALVEWACGSALERLGAASPAELAHFWLAVPIADAAAWCRKAVSEGRAVPVRLGDAAGGKPKPGVARPDWARRARRAPEPPAGLRLLAPFDPIVRDRKRLARLFAFDYRFEAFTPAAKRKYGYYVMPILEGDRFVGRLDPRLDRARKALVVEGVWWEPGVKPSRARGRAFEAALEKLAARIGAEGVELPRARSEP